MPAGTAAGSSRVLQSMQAALYSAACSQFVPGLQMVKRLTRKQIAAGLETVPLEVVLLGAAGAGSPKLSAKDREFARQIALGESKAAAFRKSRPSKAKPETQSRRGQEIAKRGPVQAQIEAFKVAIEAQKYATPAHLRALVIEQLTRHAIDPVVQPAQRLKALELLGKVTEVAAFTERREVVQVQDSRQIRERLVSSLRLALASADAIDIETPEAGSIGQGENPPPTHPPDRASGTHPPLLSNPHIQSQENSDPPRSENAHTLVTSDIETPPGIDLGSPVTPEKNLSVTPVTLTFPNEINNLDPKFALTSDQKVTAVTVGGTSSSGSVGWEDKNGVPDGGWK